MTSDIPNLIVLGMIKNHDSFYASLRSRFRTSDDHCLYFEERPSFSNIVRIIRLSTKDSNNIFIVEEFFSPILLATLSILSLLRIRRGKYYLCIHNSNRWIFPPHRLSIRRIANFIARRMFLHSDLNLIAVSEACATYLSSAIGKPVEYVPFSTHLIPRSPNILTPSFTVPGNVEESRRDYATLISAMEVLSSEGIPYHVHFLGTLTESMTSQVLRDSILEFQQKYPATLITYSKFVSQEDYEFILAKSSALICNLQPVFVSDETVEIYGITKESGIHVLANIMKISCLIDEKIPHTKEPFYTEYSDAQTLAFAMKETISKFNAVLSKGVQV